MVAWAGWGAGTAARSRGGGVQGRDTGYVEYGTMHAIAGGSRGAPVSDTDPGALGASGTGHLVLVGMMGAGKTTTGQELAARLGWRFVDSDADVEARSGGTAARLAASEGVDALHGLESRVVLEALASDPPAVVAAAASVVDSEACRRALARAALVVWLDVPAGDLWERTATGAHRRPMGRSAAEVVLARRLTRFAEVADLRIDGRRPTERIVTTVLRALGQTRS